MSDPLLVPMHLEAMVLSDPAEAAEAFQLAQADYGNLESFQPPGPAPFANLGTPEPGIHLHWTLPRPLRHAPDATQSGDGWPFVPNRWVVVRIPGAEAAAEPVKAWIVCSDAPDGTSPYVTSSDGVTSQGTTIGKNVVMTPSLTEVELPAAGAPVLKAVGPGTATFAIFAPGVRDVFALYDDMGREAGKTIPKGTFTYHVAGWYANPGDDPLARVEWEPPNKQGVSVDKTFGFAAWLGGAGPPTRMLVHAMRYSVAWDSEANNPRATRYPTDVPTQVSVAVGNTAVDGLAALVRLTGDAATAQTRADLLEAFQYGALDALDKPASSVVLDHAIRRNWFGALPAGTLWTVVAPEPPGPTALPTPAPAPLTAQQADALAALNVAQRELDRQQRLLDGMGWNLYALWFKQQQAINASTSGLDDFLLDWFTKQLAVQVGAQAPSRGGTSYLDQVTSLRTAIGASETAVAAAMKTLTGLLDTATQQVKQASMPQYHAPTDPVVLITGLGRSSNLDPVGDLTCRLPAQAVTALTIDGQRYDASDVTPLPDPGGLLPAGVQALHTEAVFLSASLCAESILHDASKAPDVTAAIAALPAPAAAAQFLPAAGSWELWKQPWVPVLLDWRITVLDQPAYEAGAARVHELQQALWHFDGTDYAWAGPTDPGDGRFDQAASSSMQLSGRTFVTPQLNFTLADRLDTYVATHHMRDPALDGPLDALDGYLDTLRSADVLSQRLSGLRARLGQRDLTPAPQPTGAVAEALDGLPYCGFPQPYPDVVSGAVWDFAPAAGTFFVIDGLTIIDFMGRAVDLTLANGSTAVPVKGGPSPEYWFYPVAGRGMRAPTTKDPVPYPGESTDPTQRMLQLPPRLSQEAQVSFRAIANDDSNVDVDLAGGANPLCGWIVPNHLDRSLAVYAPDGTPWGELFLSRHPTEGLETHWQPDPTNDGAPASPDAIPNPYTSAMLGALARRNDGGAGLSDFMLAIDETLWGIEPGGPRKDQDLSVLIGRPLAIVRAELALKLRGTVWTSQDWWNTFEADPKSWPAGTPAPLAEVDGGVRDMLWPVRLGDSALRDDGLIGYFLDEPGGPDERTWASFSVVRRPAKLSGDYLKLIGDDAGYVKLRFTDDTVERPDPAQAQAQRLTMLIDPRANVHAFTGMLPVTTFGLRSSFITPALRAMTYLFRAGPFLTSPDAVRLPRPAERNGTWSWFDSVLQRSVPITPADGRTRLAPAPPVALEGWLKLTPNPSQEPNA